MGGGDDRRQLALGTGANAAVYSALDALLLRPPPGVAAPATLVGRRAWGSRPGVAGAVIASRVARALVYELPTPDPGLTAVTAAALVVVVAAAVAPQAWRAVRINPILVLRD